MESVSMVLCFCQLLSFSWMPEKAICAVANVDATDWFGAKPHNGLHTSVSERKQGSMQTAPYRYTKARDHSHSLLVCRPFALFFHFEATSLSIRLLSMMLVTKTVSLLQW
jgi:hypothetical protein